VKDTEGEAVMEVKRLVRTKVKELERLRLDKEKEKDGVRRGILTEWERLTRQLDGFEIEE
jgi:hypothetical protein